MVFLKLLSQILLFGSSLCAGLFLYQNLLKKEFSGRWSNQNLLTYSLVGLCAGFVIGAETLLSAGLYILMIVGGFYGAKYFLKKGKIIEEKILKVIVSFSCMILGFLVLMQPENYLQGNAGNLSAFSLFGLTLFVSVSAVCGSCYLFSFLRDKRKIKPRLQHLNGEVYLFYSSILIALTSFIFLMFTESIPAMFFIFISSFLFMTVFYIFAVEKERDVIYSKVQLLFGFQFILIGLLIASSFALLLGLLWIVYIMPSMKFNELREIMVKRLNLVKLKERVDCYQCRIVNTGKKVFKRKKK